MLTQKVKDYVANKVYEAINSYGDSESYRKRAVTEEIGKLHDKLEAIQKHLGIRVEIDTKPCVRVVKTP
jgi:hypothetical protein